MRCPFGRLWYGEPDAVSNAVGYAKFFSRAGQPGWAAIIPIVNTTSCAMSRAGRVGG